MVEFGHDLKPALTHARDSDWAADQARNAYEPKIIPVLDNGARVGVGNAGSEFQITVTPGLLAQLPAALREGLRPGDTIILPIPTITPK